MSTTALTGSPTAQTTSTDSAPTGTTRRVVPNAELPDHIGWQRAHSVTSEIWSTITDAHRDGDHIVVTFAEFPAGPELRLDTTATRAGWNTSIVRRPLTCRRCRRPLSRRNTRLSSRVDIAFTHVVDGALVDPCDEYGAAPLPAAPPAGSSVTARGGLDYVRVSRYDGYDGLHEDDMVVMHDGLVVAGTYRTRPNRSGEDWASWGPAGDSSGHTTREAAEDVQIAAHRAGLADEQTTFFDRGQGRLSTIARYGRRIIVIERGDVLADHTFDTDERAAAEYANWKCDRRTDVPQRGDVIEILGVMDTDTVLRVSTVSVSTVSVSGTDHTRYKIRGTRLGGDGTPGVSVSRTVTRPAFFYVSRGVSRGVSTGASVPTGGVSAPAAPTGVSPGVAVSTTGVSTPAGGPGVSTGSGRAVPTAPRSAPVMWSDVVRDRRPDPRIIGPRPAPVLPTTGHLVVEYCIQAGGTAGEWATVDAGKRRLRHVTFDAVEGVADALLAQAWRGDNRVRVTVAGTTASGRPVVATMDGYPTGSRTRPRSRRRPLTAFVGGPGAGRVRDPR